MGAPGPRGGKVKTTVIKVVKLPCAKLSQVTTFIDLISLANIIS